jgi:hypothetical protein
MLNIRLGAGAAGTASLRGSGSTKMIRLLAASAPKHCMVEDENFFACDENITVDDL